MKKFFVLVLVFTIFTVVANTAAPYMMVNAPYTPVFARVKYNNAHFYHLPSDTATNSKLFLLEQHYFVEITGEENELFYRAKYLNLDGYVKKAQVERILETPQVPYLNQIYFNINPHSNVALRVQATSELGDQNLVMVLEKNTQNIFYYGKLSGQEAILGLGNLWYYCAHQTQEGSTVYGYVYAPLTTNLTAIAPNVEAVTLAAGDEASQIGNFLTIAPQFRLVLIGIVFLPTLFILYLLFAPSKQKKNIR